MSVDEIISERTLREIYLKPFEIAVKEGKPWAVMTAYNSVNGEHSDSNKFLLQKVLRGDWGWNGLVMSDWWGTNSVGDSIQAGLDLEMPGPARRRKIPAILEAVANGEVTEKAITDRARNVLEFLYKVTAFEGGHIPHQKAIDKPEHRSLIRDAGARGIVLLKNEDNVLPLTQDKIKGKKIAVLGMAKHGLAHGGGSASVNAHYKTTPWDALQGALGDTAELIYGEGFDTYRLLPTISHNVMDLQGNPGWTLKLIDHQTNEIADTIHGYATSFVSPLGHNDTENKCIEIVGDFTPTETGNHYIGATGIGPAKVYIDEQPIYNQTNNCTDVMSFLFDACPEFEFQVQLNAGQPYGIKIYTQPASKVSEVEALGGRSGVRLGFLTESEHDRDLTTEAVQVAKNADFALVFTGHDPQWETEGVDRSSFNLPRGGSQDALVSAVAAVNTNTIVINSTGAPVSMPWLNNISALLQTWFLGQECGNAIVDVLTGQINPEGRLPVSFPKKLEDTPAYGNFPGELVNSRRRVTYSEGIFVGYRHYDRTARDILNFPFGYGMSYTSFTFQKLEVDKKSNDNYVATVQLTNTGSAQGGTLVQLYVGAAETAPENPVKILAAFQKVRLQPKEVRIVQVPIYTRDFAVFNEKMQKWVVVAGCYNITLAESAADPVHVVKFSVEEDLTYLP